MARSYKRDAKGRFASTGGKRGGKLRANLRKSQKARQRKRAAGHREIARRRTLSNRSYVRATGDRGTQADTNKLRKRNAKSRARAAKLDRKARR